VIDLLICHAPSDHNTAAEIAEVLRETAEASVWLEESDPAQQRSVAVTWEYGLSSAGIVLLLSPDAVPSRLVRSDWQELLSHVERGETPPVFCVMLRECRYPQLLERKRFSRWAGEHCSAMREVQRWAMSLHPSQPLRFAPAPLPWFRQREHELDRLFELLVDRAGTVVIGGKPETGKTSLAQEFASRANEYFRSVLWISCANRSLAAIAGDLAHQLGTQISGSLEETCDRVLDLSGRHRVLLVLDDVGPDALCLVPSGVNASVLLVTGQDLELTAEIPVIQLEEVVSAPLASPSSESDLQLWQAMGVCRNDGFSLDLAARIAGLDLAEAVAACERLVARHLVDPFHYPTGRMRLSRRSCRAALSEAVARLQERHAGVLRETFLQYSREPEECDKYLPEVQPALEWALRHDWPLATSLAECASAFLRAQHRQLEAAQILERLREEAMERQDSSVVETCQWELSWLESTTYAPRTALSMNQLVLDFG
jgi:hypothetical protein